MLSNAGPASAGGATAGSGRVVVHAPSAAMQPSSDVAKRIKMWITRRWWESGLPAPHVNVRQAIQYRKAC
jgi:hypothetical protein